MHTLHTIHKTTKYRVRIRHTNTMKPSQLAYTDLMNEWSTGESKSDASSFEVVAHSGGKKMLC